MAGTCLVGRAFLEDVMGMAFWTARQPLRRVLLGVLLGAALTAGQGSLFHPRYSGVTLSLLHGTMPHGLIACYEMGRKVVFGMPDVPLPSLRRLIDFYEAAANIMHPCRVIGVAINGMRFSAAEVEAECARVEEATELPACDVIRHGPGKLVEAVRKMKAEVL